MMGSEALWLPRIVASLGNSSNKLVVDEANKHHQQTNNRKQQSTSRGRRKYPFPQGPSRDLLPSCIPPFAQSKLPILPCSYYITPSDVHLVGSKAWRGFFILRHAAVH
jgi:hypothetical protein